MKSVSVVMPTFNSIRTIKACLASIREQDYGGKVEIVAADGGSTDGSLAVLKKYDCKIVKERTGSPEKAKAVGLKEAKGELVLLMASDNILPNNIWLKTMVDSLQKRAVSGRGLSVALCSEKKRYQLEPVFCFNGCK